MAASMPYTSNSAAATPETLSNGRFGAEGNGGGRGGGGGGGDDLHGILSTGFTLSPRSCWKLLRSCRYIRSAMAMSFTVSVPPLRPSSVLHPAAASQSYEPTTSGLYTLLPYSGLYFLTQANQFERNYDARRLCNWEVRRHTHAC